MKKFMPFIIVGVFVVIIVAVFLSLAKVQHMVVIKEGNVDKLPIKMELHKYQHRAIDFIMQKKRVALLLSMGLGKTVATLTAIANLIELGEVKTVVIVAPLRVANSVWKQECQKWEHLKHLKLSIATGSVANRKKAFTSDIVVINRENITWMMSTMRPQFDMLVVDESSSFKSAKSQRFKALKKLETKYTVLLTGTPSITNNASLIQKVYFPREILPLTCVLSQLIHFALALLVLFLWLLISKIKPTIYILFLPLIILLQFIFTLGVSFIFATANVFVRDIEHLMELILLVWFYATPIFYNVDRIPEKIRTIYLLNPTASLVTFYRDIFLYGKLPNFYFLTISFLISIFTLIVGWLYFQIQSKKFPEEI